jgi:organic radical activating enzyme
MIHSGLNINLKADSTQLGFNQCCLSSTPLTFVDNNTINWSHSNFNKLRLQNSSEQWHDGCWQCERLEKTGAKSFRKSMIERFGVIENVSGPQRIDLLFDRSCNLACRTCGPMNSTFWSKHLKDNNLPVAVFPETNNIDKIKNILTNLDLNNLGMVQFCGGETLLGRTYWQAAELLAELVPDAKNQLELGFQTNGTQPIDEKYFEVIEKFKLVKLMISLDSTRERFEYLRWPASWNQTVDNILQLRESLPSNVMFLVQETTSCLNLFYFDEVSTWVKENFRTNREGDLVDYSTQLAIHQYLDVRNITQEYVDALAGTKQIHTIGKNWKENPDIIKRFIAETEKFDALRGQDWKKVFPEVAEFYKRYI